MKMHHQKNQGRLAAATQNAKNDAAPTKYHSEKSGHILSISSNLLGICFIVLTSVKVLGKANETAIDEIAAICIVVFMSSCILSFLSIRTIHTNGIWLENMADTIFLGGLLLLFITAILFSFNIIQ